MLSNHRRTALAAGLVASSLGAMGGIAAAASKDQFAGYLLHSGEQTGYTLAGKPAVIADAAAYVKLGKLKGAAAAKATRLLTNAGFAGGAEESLKDSGGRQGFSLIGTFTKTTGPKQVRDALYSMAVSEQRTIKMTTVSTFRIPGVASARGVTAVSTTPHGLIATANVYWTEGACAFGSGLYWPGSDGLTNAKVDAPVVAGVKAQIKRTDSRCVAPPEPAAR